MHSGRFQFFSTTTSTLFTLLFSSLLPHPPVTEEVSSERAGTHQGRSAGRGKRGRSPAAWRERRTQRCYPGTRRARSRRRPHCPEERVPAGAESARARLREAPVPPPGHPPRAARGPGASPPAPGAGSSRGARRETSWRMRGDQRLEILLSRMPSVTDEWPMNRENSHGWPTWETLELEVWEEAHFRLLGRA